MHRRGIAIVFAGLVALAGCGDLRPAAGQRPSGGAYQVPTGDPTGGPGGGTATVNIAGCTSCHGTPGFDNANADPLVASAPPVALSGNPADPAIGAHRAHLVDGPFRHAVECASCHLVPATIPGHLPQKQGKVSFSRLATTAWTGPPVSPTWNGTSCASTYCHGNFTNGNAANAPSWIGGAAQAACGSCHGIPPGVPHPQDPPSGPPLDCGTCHPGYTRTSVNLALHLNGAIDGGGHPSGWKEPDQHGLAALQGGLSACTTCHAGFGPVSGIAGSSCDLCHATPSLYGPYATGTYPDHPSWQTECTFCHGGRDNATGAPPRNTHVISTSTLAQLTTDPTIGAHSSHVMGPHAIATPLDCTACHQTRWASATDPGHIDKPTADVFFNAVGSTANPGSYTRPDCSSTYCHGGFAGGAGAGPVAWTGTFGGAFTLSCTSCHGAPPGPTSATIHHPPNPSCASCHTGYTASSVNVATHVDGTVQHTPATGCTQCHGDITVTAVANTDVRAAPAGDASAVDAHGNPATATTARGVGVHAKHLTGTTWRSTAIACSECHTVPAANDTSHITGTPVVAFGTLAKTAWAGQPAINPVWNGAGGAPTLTCSSTYCHGDFKNGANASPTWTAPGSVTCGSCHGTPPGGTHPANSNCAQCHDAAYSWNGTIGTVNPTLHMNGVLDVVNLTCTSCHGTTGRIGVAGADPNQAAAPPVDTHGLVSSAAVGAHLAHLDQGDAAAPGPLSSPLGCSSCHVVPSSTTHSTGTVTVTFGGLATTGGATPAPYDFTGHTCASTYCHGSFTGGTGANAIQWTAAGKLSCTSCHGAPPGPTSATIHHPPNPSCASCHTGYTAASVNVATHVNGTVDHTPATGCTQCHGDITVTAVANTDVRAAPAGDASAVDAHGNPATATTARGVGVHAKHLTGTTWRSTPIACNECHTVPAANDTLHINGTPVVTFGTLAKTAWAGQPAINPVWNGAGGAPTLTCSSTYCHGDFPNAVTSASNPTPTWTAAGSVVCGSCHGVSATNGPGGSHPTLSSGQDCGSCHGGSYTNTAVDPVLHMNGKLDGGGESTGGIACGGCHGGIFSAMNGGVTHATKHTLGATAGTNDSPTDSGLTWANPLSSNAPAARSCVDMCHGDHPHDLQSPATTTHENNAYLDATTGATRADGTANRIGIGGTGGAPNRMKTDYDGTQANGGLCASCHQYPVDAGHPAIGKSAFDASAHDYATNTVGTTTYGWSYQLHDGSLFVRDCTKCHASSAEGTTPPAAANGSATVAVHYSDNPSLLSGTVNPAGTAAGYVCYNCHGSTAAPAAGAQGNRSGKDIQSQIAHATTSGQSGHPANGDSVHNSVNEYSSATFGNALGVAAGSGQRHANCLDCHDPHQAKAGTHAQGTNVAGPPLQGAWGVKWTGTLAAWGTPTSANFIKTPITAGTDLEATLCFKCHSAYYGTLPTSPSSSPAFTETDQAREFNPANPSFHPVLASAGSNQGATSNILAPWTRTSLMTCTDCHESDVTTDPNGPHGSAAKFILKGPNTKWDATVTMTSTGMPAGTFCANCHAAAFTNSRFPGHTNGHHNVACFSCHVTIPHGSGHMGMLVSLATPPDGVKPTDSAPYASGVRLGIGSYPTATGTWQNNNCGCGNVATGH